jgi:competence protein ComEC
MSLADSMNIPIKTVYTGKMIHIDPTIRLFVLGPDQNASGRGNINNASVSFRLDYKENSFLFTGDAEAAQEQQLVSRFGDFLDTDVLKTGHHGSKTSSTIDYLSKVTPEITFTSLAYQNRFGHPHHTATARLKKSGAKNYFTSLSGALIFKSDGKNIVREQ